MIVRHLYTVYELLAVLAQPTSEMQQLYCLLNEQVRRDEKRTWERRLQAIPATLLAQIGCLGRFLVSLIQPWYNCGRAVAIDSTILRNRGGLWHQKHRFENHLDLCVGLKAFLKATRAFMTRPHLIVRWNG